ncbi:MAG: class I SAM-dependent methyltransferase [Acidobacteriota bacterium]
MTDSTRSAVGTAIVLASLCVAAAAQPPKNRLFPAQELGLIEPPDRDQWQPPDLIMDRLRISDGAAVAELGAGGGWFVVQLAHRVAQHGVVYAEDVQPEMIQLIRRRVQRENLTNVRPVLGTATDPMLPPGLDAVLIVDAYREMACAVGPACQDPVPLLKNVARSLKPRGLLGIVDFNRGEGGPGPGPDVRVDPEAVIRAAAEAGLRLEQRENLPPFQFQYLLVFGKAASPRGAQ